MPNERQVAGESLSPRDMAWQDVSASLYYALVETAVAHGDDVLGEQVLEHIDLSTGVLSIPDALVVLMGQRPSVVKDVMVRFETIEANEELKRRREERELHTQLPRRAGRSVIAGLSRLDGLRSRLR